MIGGMSVRAESLMDRLSPGLQAMICEHLSLAYSTNIKVDDKENPWRPCLFMSQVVEPENGEICDEDIARLERLMTYLLQDGLVAHAMLSDPMSLPLKDEKIAILWYVFSDYSREWLNNRLGCECFVEEGALHFGAWPQVATNPLRIPNPSGIPLVTPQKIQKGF
jgi:hypothetical protein